MSEAASPKIAKPKKFASHPSYSEMVAQAIVALADKKGSTRIAIKKYILAHFEIEDNKGSNTHLNLSLKRGVAGGKLVTAKGHAGHFKTPKAEKLKKAAHKTPKKVAATKSAAKKTPKKDAKKPAAKKSPVKAAKKSATKKPAAKKSLAKKVARPKVVVKKPAAKKTAKKAGRPKKPEVKKAAAKK